MPFKEFKEHAVRSGLGTALCYKMPSETKYHILSAVESLPAVFGTPESLTYYTTTNRSVTTIKGKKTTENIEISLPYNLDNISIMNKIQNQKIGFAYIDLDDFSGQEFVAEADYHLGEVGTDGVKTIILTLAVNSAESQITKDLYDLYMDTISFDDALPSVVETTTTNTTGESIIISVEPSGATITATTSSSSIAEATYSSGTLKIVGKAAGSAIVTVKAELTNYASNQREIKVIVK